MKFFLVLASVALLSAQTPAEHRQSFDDSAAMPPEGGMFGPILAKHNPPPPPPSQQAISMEACDWKILYSQGMPSRVSAVTGGGWSFDFPLYTSHIACYNNAKCPHVNYVMLDANTKFTPFQTVTMVFEIQAKDVIFDYKTEAGNTCDSQPADFSLMIEHAGDDLYHEFYRWWAFPSRYTITNGTHSGKVTMSIPLDPALWISVYGKAGSADAAAQADFADTLANIGRVGFTLGGGCFAGHGAYLTSGSAKFVVTSFTVQ